MEEILLTPHQRLLSPLDQSIDLGFIEKDLVTANNNIKIYKYLLLGSRSEEHTSEVQTCALPILLGSIITIGLITVFDAIEKRNFKKKENEVMY